MEHSGLVFQCQDCQTAEPLQEDGKDNVFTLMFKETPLKAKGNFTNCMMNITGQNNILHFIQQFFAGWCQERDELC